MDSDEMVVVEMPLHKPITVTKEMIEQGAMELYNWNQDGYANDAEFNALPESVKTPYREGATAIYLRMQSLRNIEDL